MGLSVLSTVIINCYVTPARALKTRMLMKAFVAGVRGSRQGHSAQVLWANAKRPADVHVVWGQFLDALDIVPYAVERGETVVNIDNGWIKPGRGGTTGFYRLTVNGPAPRLVPRLPADRIERVGVDLAPWRTNGRHVLLCMPGPHYGAPWGISSAAWCADIRARIAAATDRPVVVRDKGCHRPLAEDLRRAWCVVTFASSCAVEAIVAGVPVFCAPGCAAEPVARTDLELERPVMPDRDEWLASIAGQQFLVPEITRGDAWRFLTSHFPEFKMERA